MIVVDTNVIAYLFIEGDHTAIAEKVRETDRDWAAPLLWRSEMCNVLMLYLRRRIMDLADAQMHMSQAEKMLLDRGHEIDSSRVLELANDSGCSAYDCEFVALAEKLFVRLVTADKKLIATFPSVAISMTAFVDGEIMGW